MQCFCGSHHEIRRGFFAMNHSPKTKVLHFQFLNLNSFKKMEPGNTTGADWTGLVERWNLLSCLAIWRPEYLSVRVECILTVRIHHSMLLLLWLLRVPLSLCNRANVTFSRVKFILRSNYRNESVAVRSWLHCEAINTVGYRKHHFIIAIKFGQFQGRFSIEHITNVFILPKLEANFLPELHSLLHAGESRGANFRLTRNRIVCNTLKANSTGQQSYFVTMCVNAKYR